MIPIVILSAHSDKEFLFEAIKLNLVEYLTKPVDRNKFKSVLENSINKVKENSPNNQFIHFAKTTYWDCSKRLFFHKNKMIDLTRNERILFELLLNNKNEIINPNEISKYVWGNETEINDASIRNLVKRLRKKLPVDIIQSIYGSGYTLSH
jgi:DNA-binding response OmpR family regulator